MKHDIEIKVRLTEQDADFLKQLAARNDMPPAVLARMLIIRGLTPHTPAAVSRLGVDNGRAA